MGDYVNLSIDLSLDLTQLPGVCFPLHAIPQLPNLPTLEETCQEVQDAVQECVRAIPDLNVRECIGALLTGLPEVADSVVCGLVPSICRNGRVLGDVVNAVDDLLGGPLGTRGSGGGNAGGGGSGGGLDGLLDNLTGSLGLGRAPFGDLTPAQRGHMYGEILSRHDKTLVNLMMAPMVVGR